MGQGNSRARSQRGTSQGGGGETEREGELEGERERESWGTLHNKDKGTKFLRLERNWSLILDFNRKKYRESERERQRLLKRQNINKRSHKLNKTLYTL